MKYIDDFLNKFTMYRLVTYGLIIVALAALFLALGGKVSFSPSSLVISVAIILFSGYVTNRLFGWLWDVPTNSESWLITGLILFLILQPATDMKHYLALALAGAISSASKFLLAWRGKHVFNPAALAAAIMSLSGLTITAWWVGSSALWPFALVIGLAVVRKIHRFPLVITFASLAIFIQVAVNALLSRPQNLHSMLLSSPLIFLATIMLTEPATNPPRLRQQLSFAAIIAFFYATSLNLGVFYIYPEVALLLGNIYAYLVAPKFRWRLELKEVRRVSDRVYDYVFQPDRRMSFLAGQYMEWTLAGVPYDSRGNRRSFTIASSPTESSVRLGLKYYEPSSAFKSRVKELKPGDVIYASQLAGNFVLGNNEKKKLLFVAGGIGITPFRSMLKYLTDTGNQFDIVLLYLLADPSELAYREEFLAARQQGLRFLPISAKPGEGVQVAEFNQDFLAKQIPDIKERTSYISGPHPMVESTKAHLRGLGVPMTRIKTDHFSGY